MTKPKKKRARKNKNPMATADELRAAILKWTKKERIASADSIGFWTPEQWEKHRTYAGEPETTGFIVHAEGTQFNHALGYGDSPGDVKIYEGWEDLLQKNGWWWNALTTWAFHVYPDGASLTESNPRKRREKRPVELAVVVRTQGGDRRVAVPMVTAIGDLAVHPSIRNAEDIRVLGEIERGERSFPHAWAVTHMPSGQLVATVRLKDWAHKLAKEIVAFSGPGLSSPDPHVAARAIAGDAAFRLNYIIHVSRQSEEAAHVQPGDRGGARGKFPTYKAWKKTAHELTLENPQDLASQAAVAAAVGALVGGIIGAVGGAVLLGVTGAAIGAATGAGGAGTGAVVGGMYGVGLGSYIGTIWGAVRQTDRALEGHDATSARILAGLGAAFTGPFAPVGAGVGAYLGAPK